MFAVGDRLNSSDLFNSNRTETSDIFGSFLFGTESTPVPMDRMRVKTKWRHDLLKVV